MAFIKNISRIGNSNGIIIEKRVLDILDIDEETPLKFTTDGTSLVITPLRRHRSLQEILFKNFIKYGETLRDLAK
ncbi:MAG: AbrB/MazE/SpoVT family DNA-binding domain-containing protein [bacterium]|nr:AbrB/MazE/SpoVT family DNA-binding domain-containing protein [bacterium]